MQLCNVFVVFFSLENEESNSDSDSSSIIYVDTVYPIDGNVAKNMGVIPKRVVNDAGESLVSDSCKDDGDQEYSADESSVSTDQSWSISSHDYTEQLKLLYAGVGSMELKTDVNNLD